MPAGHRPEADSSRPGAGPAGSSPGSAPSDAEAEEILHDALEALGDADRVLQVRLARVRSSVRFAIGDGSAGVTLLLDRIPVGVLDRDEPAEIEIRLDASQAARYARGELPLAGAAYVGAIDASGPIRKYLEVDPIIRGVLASENPGAQVRWSSEELRPRYAPHDDLMAIETRDLHKSFGRQTVLKGIDLAIPEGVISVVLGPSGTGKSVLLSNLIGLLAPDRGDVIIRGRALSSMSRSEVLGLRREIGVMFQDGALFTAFNVYENTAFPLREHTDLADDQIDEIVRGRLREVGLEAASGRFPGQLSGGMKKRAGLARALVLDPGILLCDEPDSGLDPVRTALLADLLIAQHARTGGVVLVVTHDIALARRVAGHVSVIWQGKIVESGLADDVFNSDNEFVHQFLGGESAGPLGMD